MAALDQWSSIWLPITITWWGLCNAVVPGLQHKSVPLWTRVLSLCPISCGLESGELPTFWKVNISHYGPDFVIPKMDYTVTHLLKNSSLSINNGVGIAQIIGDVVLVNNTGKSLISRSFIVN